VEDFSEGEKRGRCARLGEGRGSGALDAAVAAAADNDDQEDDDEDDAADDKRERKPRR
jgi:hypothetical protein